MVPGVNNACSHMLALRGYFIAVGRLLDADGKLLVCPVGNHCQNTQSDGRTKVGGLVQGMTYFVCSVVRNEVMIATVPESSPAVGALIRGAVRS